MRTVNNETSRAVLAACLIRLGKLCFSLAAAGMLLTCSAAEGRPEPVRFAIVGLTHDHAGGFMPAAQGRDDIQLAGIVEPREELAQSYARRFHLSTNLFHRTIESLLATTNVQAVATFTSTWDHRNVVEQCARRGIHVMMEKPLAVNMEHAKAIQAAAEAGKIRVIVNYETTWYPSVQGAFKLVTAQKTAGELRKLVIHDGHRGPKEIGCSAAFLEWLTDPVLNGGGALTDFGCYGADLSTWFMGGQRPLSVTALTQTNKPAVYPKVEDEATIVLEYPKAQTIIQASWNWPFDRKDMEIYGATGYVYAPGKDQLKVRAQGEGEKTLQADPLKGNTADPLSYLAAIVRGELEPEGLSSLAVNMVVTEILDAARESAKTGRVIKLR
jgi:predicted dehydrogenase